jgi:hypothetical protein
MPECRYAECRYAECHYAECRGAFLTLILVKNDVLLRLIFLKI